MEVPAEESTMGRAKGDPSKKAVWRRYYTQEEALAYVKTRPYLLVTAMDKVKEGGKKMYAAASPYAAFLACMQADPAQLLALAIDDTHQNVHVGRHQYEMLMADRPMRIFYDGEYMVSQNTEKSGPACRDALLHYMQRSYAQIPNRPMDQLEMIDVETSHRVGEKVSFHGKVPLTFGIVANMEAQRAFWAHTIMLASLDLSVDENHVHASALRVKTLRKAPNGPHQLVDAWFWDHGVYTKNRLMRFLGASKWPKHANAVPSYLVREGQERTDITYDIWRNSLVSDHERIVEEKPVVLQIPDEWYGEAKQFWDAPLQAVSVPASLSSIHGALTRTYREKHFPFDALVRMATVMGRFSLAQRDMTIISVGGVFMHDFKHASVQELRTSMTFNQTATMQFGDVVSEVSGPLARYTVKELFFDIDVTDYDKPSPVHALPTDTHEHSVRFCPCAGTKKLCAICWVFVEVASLIIDDLLRRRMGVPDANILWVFSGAKGLHVICNSPSCMLLSLDERKALVDHYLQMDMDTALRFPLKNEVNAHLFANILLPYFEQHFIQRLNVLQEKQTAQRWLAWARHLEPNLARAWEEIIEHTAISDWNGPVIWQRMKEAQTNWLPRELGRLKGWKQPLHVVYWIVAMYTWPRVDYGVTTKKRAQLKTPFSINRTSKCIALPIECPGRATINLTLLSSLTTQTVGQTIHHDIYKKGLEMFTHWTNVY